MGGGVQHTVKELTKSSRLVSLGNVFFLEFGMLSIFLLVLVELCFDSSFCSPGLIKVLLYEILKLAGVHTFTITVNFTSFSLSLRFILFFSPLVVLIRLRNLTCLFQLYICSLMG